MSCRQDQLTVLSRLLFGNIYPSAIAIHGASGTGKTTTLRQFFSNASFKASWIQCDQCMTTRILLQRALKQVFSDTNTGVAEEAVCENVDIFLSLLKSKFDQHNFTDRHCIVLDRIDQLPDYRAVLDLYFCLSRIRELAPGLTNVIIMFVYRTSEPRALIANPAVPRIWFPRYTFDETVWLLKESVSEICADPDRVWDEKFKYAFLELVCQALTIIAGNNIAQLKRMASQIWPSFIKDASPGDSVAKLYVRNSSLFQADKLVDKLELPSFASQQMSPVGSFLLCAAYLASYNPPRYDMRYFSLAKSMRNKRRETRPKKSITIPVRSLAPPAFEMERLLAIFHAIHPDAFGFQPTTNVGREIATLSAQNLLVKTQIDPLDSRTKWKINVPWSYVQRLASDIDFNIDDYIMDAA